MLTYIVKDILQRISFQQKPERDGEKYSNLGRKTKKYKDCKGKKVDAFLEKENFFTQTEKRWQDQGQRSEARSSKALC